MNFPNSFAAWNSRDFIPTSNQASRTATAARADSTKGQTMTISPLADVTQGTETAAPASRNPANKETFLQLLVAQIKNQNPPEKESTSTESNETKTTGA
jgi:flagellar hook assembly protein FlgD